MVHELGSQCPWTLVNVILEIKMKSMILFNKLLVYSWDDCHSPQQWKKSQVKANFSCGYRRLLSFTLTRI